MIPFYEDEKIQLWHGDCVDVMKTFPAESIDSVVCDPPYGLEFMGKDWDKIGDVRQPTDTNYPVSESGPHRRAKVRHSAAPSYGNSTNGMQDWHELWAREALRILKPGGYLLAFGGSRTYHRLACAIEDAGFEIRDQIMWIYGSGFPKSLNVSKAFDKSAGVEFRAEPASGVGFMKPDSDDWNVTKNKLTRIGDQTDLARQWDGWGTALKPAHEPIVIARKPLIGTVARNVEKYGTGALNIDGCRVEHDEECRPMKSQLGGNKVYGQSGRYEPTTELKESGRWPANVIHDGSDEVVELFPQQKSGTLTPDMDVKESTGWSGGSKADRVKSVFKANSGSAARFFYCAKAAKKERGESNKHPTVKPLTLMKYLVRLVTPLGGIVLDPFTGSGTTLLAAADEGFHVIGIEQSEEYCNIALDRIAERTV